jgi:hypothetical protein
MGFFGERETDDRERHRNGGHQHQTRPEWGFLFSMRMALAYGRDSVRQDVDEQAAYADQPPEDNLCPQAFYRGRSSVNDIRGFEELMYDRDKILTRSKLKAQDADTLFLNSFAKSFGGNLSSTYEGVEDTVLEYGHVQEFEFDGFSVIVENGVFAVQFEDPEDGLVVQNLIDEGEIEPKFPYLFEADGIEKSLAEEDYRRIKDFVEGRKV